MYENFNNQNTRRVASLRKLVGPVVRLFFYLVISIVFSRVDGSRCDVRLQINSVLDKSTYICLNVDGGI